VEWAVLGLTILFAIMTYIVVQGTRAAMAWRKAAAAGDVKVIRDIVEDALTGWRSIKRPKEVPPDVWRGIQSMQLVEVGPEFVRVSCQAEGDYKLVNGRWFEQASPLHEGMAITARALDMLLYELPHFKAGRVQIDVYTTFREAGGAPRREWSHRDAEHRGRRQSQQRCLVIRQRLHHWRRFHHRKCGPELGHYEDTNVVDQRDARNGRDGRSVLICQPVWRDRVRVSAAHADLHGDTQHRFKCQQQSEHHAHPCDVCRRCGLPRLERGLHSDLAE